MKSFFRQNLKDFFLIFFFLTTITLAIWMPHYLRLPDFLGLNFSNGFETIYRNFDGLEYIVIAKTLYDPQAITNLPQSLPANYYAAHFPGYAFSILLFAPLFGFLKSMLFVSLLFTFLSTLAFYVLVRDFKLTNHPLFLSTVFLLLPARWLIVHSVGSAEPMFIFFVISALYLFMKYESSGRYSFLLLAAASGAFAQITRPPGVLLFVSLAFYIIWKSVKIRAKITYFPLVLIPLSLLAVFTLYANAYQDFWAYFHSGDNIHLTFPPFQVFNKNQFWVGDIWLEDVIYTLILGFLGGLMLFKQKLYPLAFFVLTYLAATTLVTHRDISRYALPVFPFVLIAFEKILASREFKIVLIIITLGIYLYTQNFLLSNTAPIAQPEIFNR